MLRTLVVAMSLLAAGASHAIPLDHSGAPQANLNPMGHYGLNVPVKQGLKALTPDGWAIYVHRDAKLPASLSWQQADTWVSALQTFSDLTALPVTVDWNSRSIYLKPVGMALTPTDNGVPDTLAAKQAPAPASKVAASAPSVSMETVFRDAAVTHGFSVNWASDAVKVAAAPDVAGLSAEGAFRKLATAIDGKASVTIDMVTKTIDVQPGAARLAVKDVPPTLVLTVREGQLMSTALAELAAKAGWTLRWEATEDFEAASASRIEGSDIRVILEKALPHMGLTADRYPDTKVIVVRPRG